jgi:hypothetical protein
MLTKMIVSEVVGTVIGNFVWIGYKEYCKWCWRTFYKEGRICNGGKENIHFV